MASILEFDKCVVRGVLLQERRQQRIADAADTKRGRPEFGICPEIRDVLAKRLIPTIVSGDGARATVCGDIRSDRTG
jgi:hypothetical protein